MAANLKTIKYIAIALGLTLGLALAGCQTASENNSQNQVVQDDANQVPAVEPATTANLSTCGGDKYAHLVGKRLPPISELKIPGNSRYFGKDEVTSNDNPKRLNFVVSTEFAHQAFSNPEARVLKVFCG